MNLDNKAILNASGQPAAIKLGYQAIEDLNRRQAPKKQVISEAIALPPAKRLKLLATTQDLNRNDCLIAWMLRKHVAYTSRFVPVIGFDLVDFNNKELTEKLGKIEARVRLLLRKDARKKNFDAQKMHSRNDMMEIFETLKVINGDSFLLKTSRGIQGIEGDRICWPKDGLKPIEITSDMSKEQKEDAKWQNDIINSLPDKYKAEFGVIYDEFGAPKYYIICKRDGKKKDMLYDRIVEADSIITAGKFWRFDQCRGVSQLSVAINKIQDLAESHEKTLLKIKLHAVFGIAIEREFTQGQTSGFPSTAQNANDIDLDGSTTTNPNYQTNSNDGSPLIFDYDKGGKIVPIESKTPTADVQKYFNEITRLILLALDIPFTMFDTLKASWSARVADRTEYLQSAKSKRDQNAAALKEYSDWKLEDWARTDKKLKKAMKDADIDLEELQEAVFWSPDGTSWLDGSKQVAGDALAVSSGFESINRVCLARTGLPYEMIARQNAKAVELSKKLGVPLVIGAPGTVSDTTVAPVSEQNAEDPNDPQDNEIDDENPTNDERVIDE